MLTRFSPAQLALGLLATMAGACSAQVKWLEGVLTDEAGVPLFVSEAEPPNVSQCHGACLNLWLPYKAPPDARPQGELTLVKRDDGITQWAFRGKPLYHWFNFEKPLDGQGMRGGNWHIVKQTAQTEATTLPPGR